MQGSSIDCEAWHLLVMLLLSVQRILGSNVWKYIFYFNEPKLQLYIGCCKLGARTPVFAFILWIQKNRQWAMGKLNRACVWACESWIWHCCFPLWMQWLSAKHSKISISAPLTQKQKDKLKRFQKVAWTKRMNSCWLAKLGLFEQYGKMWIMWGTQKYQLENVDWI